jgi:hypothetical protein
LAAENKRMNLSKYISKTFIIKLALLGMMVAFAALFDMYHQVEQNENKSTSKVPVQSDSEKVFFCNQVNNFNIKTLGTEFQIRLRFTVDQDKFLIKHYNQRTFQMMKAETSLATVTSVRDFHSIPYRRFFYSSPDDTPPLA